MARFSFSLEPWLLFISCQGDNHYQLKGQEIISASEMYYIQPVQ